MREANIEANIEANTGLGFKKYSARMFLLSNYISTSLIWERRMQKKKNEKMETFRLSKFIQPYANANAIARWQDFGVL